MQRGEEIRVILQNSINNIKERRLEFIRNKEYYMSIPIQQPEIQILQNRINEIPADILQDMDSFREIMDIIQELLTMRESIESVISTNQPFPIVKYELQAFAFVLQELRLNLINQNIIRDIQNRVQVLMNNNEINEMNYIFNTQSVIESFVDMLQPINTDTEEVIQANVRVAFEPHNLFSSLNIDEIIRYLNDFNERHPINPVTNPNNNEPDNLFQPLVAFINNNELFLPEEKEQAINKLLIRILPNVQLYIQNNNNPEYLDILKSVINFVSRQDNHFIEQYIRIYNKDCLEAYEGSSPESCIKGMFERIFLVLNETAKILLTYYPDNAIYNDITRLFPNINFNDAVQEWSQTFLESDNLNAREKKQHFIQFMKEKYGPLLTAGISRQIDREADAYEASGVFERGYFGGKWRRKKTKTKRKKKKKKTMKRKGKKSTKRRK